MPTIVRTGRGTSATTCVVDVTGVRTIFMVRGNSSTSLVCSNPNVTLVSFDSGGPRRNTVWSVASGTSGNVTFTANNSTLWGYVCIGEPLNQGLASYISNNTTSDVSGIGGTATLSGDLVSFWNVNAQAYWMPPVGYTILDRIATQNAEPSWMVGWKTVPSGSFTIPAATRGFEGTSRIELVSWALVEPTPADSGIPTIAAVTRGGRSHAGTFTVALPASSLTYYAIASYPDVHANALAPSGWTLVQQGESPIEGDWTRWSIYRAVGTPDTTWTYNSEFQSMNVAILGFSQAGVTTDPLVWEHQTTNNTTTAVCPAITVTGKALIARITTGNAYGTTTAPITPPPVNHALVHSGAQQGTDGNEWFHVAVATLPAYSAGTFGVVSWPGALPPGSQSFAYPSEISVAFKLAGDTIPTGAAAFTYDVSLGAGGSKSMRGSAQFTYELTLGAGGRKSPRGAAEFVYAMNLQAYGDAPTDPGVPTIMIHDGVQWVAAEILGVGDGSSTLQPCQILEPPN